MQDKRAMMSDEGGTTKFFRIEADKLRGIKDNTGLRQHLINDFIRVTLEDARWRYKTLSKRYSVEMEDLTIKILDRGRRHHKKIFSRGGRLDWKYIQ